MKHIYDTLTEKALNNTPLSLDESLAILEDSSLDTIQLLNAAYQVRYTHFQKKVTIHVLNNTQNGYCPEDCGYCAQNKTSEAKIDPYKIKNKDQIMLEAKKAHESGAHRYCMVFSGRGPNNKRTQDLANLIKTIKATYPIEVCLSAGLLDNEKAKILKDSGLDRLNHNLNTSESHYESICSTHTYEDRLETLSAGKNAGLQLCSGIIIGMKETPTDIVNVATKLNELKVESVPVNFLLPIPGTKLENVHTLTPDICLRTLCLFRFTNPTVELRVAAGREYHLRQTQVLSLLPANSIFMEGYLNTLGTSVTETLQMIKDGGFEIESDYDLDSLLNPTAKKASPTLKTKKDLHPVDA